VNYRPFKQEVITTNELENKMDFFINTLYTEVMSGTKQQQYKNVKRLKKLLKGFTLMLGTGVGTTTRTFAATVPTTSQTTNPLSIPITTGGENTITPVVVMQFGLKVALITIAVGVALSMSMLAIAGIYRMCRKKDIATEWSTDVIKGLVQVLISVPITYILFYLAQLLFKHLPVLNGLF